LSVSEEEPIFEPTINRGQWTAVIQVQTRGVLKGGGQGTKIAGFVSFGVEYFFKSSYFTLSLSLEWCTFLPICSESAVFYLSQFYVASRNMFSQFDAPSSQSADIPLGRVQPIVLAPL